MKDTERTNIDVAADALAIKPLPGAICPQYVLRDGKRFGPYWYRFYREGGRLRKVYVPEACLEQTRLSCLLYCLERERLRLFRRRIRLSAQHSAEAARLARVLVRPSEVAR